MDSARAGSGSHLGRRQRVRELGRAPITVIRCPPGTQGLDLAERSQKKLLMLCDLNRHYGPLSLKGWGGMLFAAEGQLDHHPMPKTSDPAQRAVSSTEAYSGHRPGASAWVARPGQSAHFMVADRKMASGHRMYGASIFMRPCAESREWVIRSLSSRKLVVSRDVSVVCDPNTRRAQLALSTGHRRPSWRAGHLARHVPGQRACPLRLAPRGAAVRAAHRRRRAHVALFPGPRCERRPCLGP